MQLATVTGLFSTAFNALRLIKESAGVAADVATNSRISEIQDAISKVQTAFLECQLKQQDLINKNRDLQTALAEKLAWDNEVTRYELFEVIPDVIVMRLKVQDDGSAAPIHYLCPDCFSTQKKFILQPQPNRADRTCGNCKKDYFFETPVKYSAQAGSKSLHPDSASILRMIYNRGVVPVTEISKFSGFTYNKTRWCLNQLEQLNLIEIKKIHGSPSENCNITKDGISNIPIPN